MNLESKANRSALLELDLAKSELLGIWRAHAAVGR